MVGSFKLVVLVDDFITNQQGHEKTRKILTSTSLAQHLLCICTCKYICILKSSVTKLFWRPLSFDSVEVEVDEALFCSTCFWSYYLFKLRCQLAQIKLVSQKCLMILSPISRFLCRVRVSPSPNGPLPGTPCLVHVHIATYTIELFLLPLHVSIVCVGQCGLLILPVVHLSGTLKISFFSLSLSASLSSEKHRSIYSDSNGLQDATFDHSVCAYTCLYPQFCLPYGCGLDPTYWSGCNLATWWLS